MANKISRTAGDDAPLSAVKNLDLAAASQGDGSQPGTLVGRTVTINRPRGELYRFWRDFSNLPNFMENIKSVSVIDGRRSHWVIGAPAEREVEWDSILTEDEPDRVIAWKSADGADVVHCGRIEFRDEPAGRGTEVTATIAYDPPAGAIGRLIASLFQKEPKLQARRDLRRFKQLMETGEVSTSKRFQAQS